jgi:hypothetical protein
MFSRSSDFLSELLVACFSEIEGVASEMVCRRLVLFSHSEPFTFAEAAD